MMRARVIKSTGSWYLVETESGEMRECRVRGKFRNTKIRSTNPVAVGDWVIVSGEDGEFVIREIEPRHNYIVRKSVNLSKASHIIASNMDLGILVATIKDPMTFPTFIDRFCVAAEAFHIPVGLVFNKVDILDDEEREVLENFMEVYRRLGYPVLACSAVTGEGLDAFKDLLKDKVSLLSGHSGVGKSSLINAIDPDLDIRIGEISTAHHTGQHTTTFAEMHKLTFGGYIVDTPGIRGFGLVDLKKEELAGYFPEMRALLPECKFYNCLHINEPGCAVKAGVEQGIVAETRYNSYINMFENDEKELYR
jgi:ribosome biogenesis GTPase